MEAAVLVLLMEAAVPLLIEAAVIVLIEAAVPMLIEAGVLVMMEAAVPVLLTEAGVLQELTYAEKAAELERLRQEVLERKRQARLKRMRDDNTGECRALGDGEQPAGTCVHSKYKPPNSNSRHMNCARERAGLYFKGTM
jgi:hypothetical protein